MKLLPFNSYFKAFHKYAQCIIENHIGGTLTDFALLINIKANELIYRANVNRLVDLPILQTQIFEAGKSYIHRFLAIRNSERDNG